MLKNETDLTLKSRGVHSSLRNLKKVDQLLDNLKEKLKKGSKKTIENSDLRYFQEVCCENDPKISCTACNAIVDFVRSNTLDLNSAFRWFIALLRSGKINSAIIRAVTDLLLLHTQLMMYDGNDYNLHVNQHPFVLILKQSNDWATIEFQLKYMFSKQSMVNDECLFSSISPFFKYVLWYSTEYKRDAWKFFISHFKPQNLQFLIETICWLKTNDNCILDVNHLFTEYHEFEDIVFEYNLQNIMCIYLAHIGCQLAKNGYDPTLTLERCLNLLQTHPITADIVLVLFAHTLTDCPAEFLNIILKTCIKLIEMNRCADGRVLWIVISSILPWLMFPASSAVVDIHSTSDVLFKVIQRRPSEFQKRNIGILLSDEHFVQFVLSESTVYWAFVIVSWMENSNETELLLEKIGELVRMETIRDFDHRGMLNLLISGILLSNDHHLDIQVKAIEVLMKTDSASQLPLILYSLARTANPQLVLKLLHSLPLTGSEKENIPLILRTVDTLFHSGKPILMALSVELYLSLWKTEERCYSYLHDHLLEYSDSFKIYNWEADVTLVKAIKDVCLKMPHIHGKEWVSTLSEMIKRHHNKQNSCAPTIFALEAIIMLCKANVMKVTSIYNVLSEPLFDDKRPQVICKFCDLIGFFFECSNNEENFIQNKTILIQAASKMWELISISNSTKEIVASAMKALSKFNKDEIPLKIIPEIYRKHVKLPREYNRATLDGAQKPEDVFNYVPGSVWICFLQDVRHDAKWEACQLLISWLSMEVNILPRSMYATLRGEPDNWNFLPDKSLCKALVQCLKKIVKNSPIQQLEVLINCLQILNGNLPKTLPLFNWVFLEPLLQLKQCDLSQQLILLFAKQSSTSSSAKCCIERYLKNITFIESMPEKEEHLKMSLETLPYLCCGVSLPILKQFLLCAQEFLLQRVTANQPNDLIWRIAVNSFRQVFISTNTNIQEENVYCTCEIAKTLWNEVSYDNEAFLDLNDVVTNMPISYVELLSSPVAMEEICPINVRKAFKLRCSAALNSKSENPFLWLNDSFDAAILCIESSQSEQQIFFDNAINLLTKFRHLHSSKWKWLLRVMGYMHTQTDQSAEIKKFVCDVFIWSVVNLSVYRPFLSSHSSFDEYYLVFPQALNSIVTNQVSCQVIEWLYYVSKSNNIADNYSFIFNCAMMSLKNDSYFCKETTWSKVVA